MISMKKQNVLNFIMGLSVILIYIIMGFTNLKILPFRILDLNPSDVPSCILNFYSFCYQCLMLAIIALIFHERLTKDFQDLKKNHKSYFQKYFKFWILVFGLTAFSNLLIQFVKPNEIAGNEEALRELFQISPIYVFCSAVLIAPFLEELVFRLGLRYMVPSKTLFIVLSGIVFGSLHLIGNIEVPLDLLYIIPYSVPGFVFGYVLNDSDNIFTTVGLHFLHNGIVMSLQMLLFFLM